MSSVFKIAVGLTADIVVNEYIIFQMNIMKKLLVIRIIKELKNLV